MTHRRESGCGVVNRSKVDGGVTGFVSTSRSAMASGESGSIGRTGRMRLRPSTVTAARSAIPAGSTGSASLRDATAAQTYADEERAEVARSPAVASAAMSTAGVSSRGHWIDRSNGSTS